jgi:hypothetical protein
VTARGVLTQLPEQPIHTFERPARLSDWSPDQQWIVASETSPGSRDDIWLVPASGGSPRGYAQSPFNEVQGVISRNGAWLAYASDESGRFEVYVDSFPTPGRRARLTTGGGSDPRWSGRGTELFFRRADEIHAVAVDMSGQLPEAVSSDRLVAAGREVRAYDVSPDGLRFLLNLPAADVRPRPISVVLNWRTLLQDNDEEALKRRE